jgi:hypothetical protein
VKIHCLSPAQLAMTPQVRDEWLKIGLDTAPVNRSKVREILGRLYAVANKPAPKHIIHLASPLQISFAIAKLRIEGEPIRLQVSDPVSGEVREQIFRRPASRVNEQAVGLVGDQTRFKSTIAALTPDLQVIGHVREQVREKVRNESVGLRAWPFQDDFGQFDVSLAWFDFVGRLGIDVSKLAPSFDLAKACGVAVLFWDWAFISAKPECIHRDERGRLHCESGAAVRYPDGFSVFAIHGVRVPEKVVVSPKSITIPEIESERNAEVRRLMIERYGPERYLMDSGAEEIHRDDFGILYRKEIPFDEPLVMMMVVNSTPEPDGSFKDYFLRVPPTMARARQAVAWTFGKEENDYSPALQT